jgi:hypothetical protein
MLRTDCMKLATILISAALAGCAGTVHYRGSVAVSDPNLVEVSPGVYTVADAEEPIFYNDGFYWLYQDGVWMRSPSYNGGFVTVDAYHVPQRVRVIDHPRAYVHYSRSHHGHIVVRDHRRY